MSFPIYLRLGHCDGDTKHRMPQVYTDLIVRVARVLVDDVMVALSRLPFENIIGISRPT